MEPLKRETLADRLLTELKRQILSGRLPANAPLPAERVLCEAFGVGRTTVREALQGLIATGFVERHNAQLVVRDPTALPPHAIDYAALAARLSVEDLFSTRKALENLAVAQAARHWTDDDLDAVARPLEAMLDPVSDEAYHAADVEFHTAIVTIGKNQVLQGVYESSKHLFFRLPAFWRVFGDRPERPAPGRISGWQGHRALYEAIAARDEDEAVRRNSQLLDGVEAKLIERLRHRPPTESTDASTPAGASTPSRPTT